MTSKKAVHFWTKQIGFEVRREESMGQNAKWIEVGLGGAESYLVIYPKSMMEDWAERKPSVVSECKSLQQTFEEMSKRGVEFTHKPKDMLWGPFAIFLDVDGNWYGLREARA